MIQRDELSPLKQEVFNGQHSLYNLQHSSIAAPSSGTSDHPSMEKKAQQPVPPPPPPPPPVPPVPPPSTDIVTNGNLSLANHRLHQIYSNSAAMVDHSSPLNFCGNMVNQLSNGGSAGSIGANGGGSVNDEKFTNFLNSIVTRNREEINNILMVGGATTSLDDRLIEEKSGHPLYDHGMCKWPGCELNIDSLPSFIK